MYYFYYLLSEGMLYYWYLPSDMKKAGCLSTPAFIHLYVVLFFPDNDIDRCS